MCSSDCAIRWSFLGIFSQSYKVTMCFVVSEEEVLYQNYQEKALHNDSDEDTEPKQPQPDEGIVVQYRPIRTSWSQLSVVRNICTPFKIFEFWWIFTVLHKLIFINFNTLCCGSVWELGNVKECHPALFCWVIALCTSFFKRARDRKQVFFIQM